MRPLAVAAGAALGANAAIGDRWALPPMSLISALGREPGRQAAQAYFMHNKSAASAQQLSCGRLFLAGGLR
jgi:hypothetical protein